MPAAKHRRPRGHIRELPSGSFQVIVYAGTDPLTKKSRYLRETLKTYTAHVSLQQAIENTTPERTDDILTLAGAFARALNKPNEAYRGVRPQPARGREPHLR